MEDIIRALLDVVRAQHSATEGTDEAPFDMNDIVDMAMNIVGRPDEADEAAEMVDSIQRLVETLAPDIFPPKTFEEMDDAERAASAASMIEERLLRGLSGGRNQAASAQQSETDRRVDRRVPPVNLLRTKRRRLHRKNLPRRKYSRRRMRRRLPQRTRCPDLRIPLMRSRPQS